MTEVIVTGHGGYASAVKRSLLMLVGNTTGFYFVDFNEQDDVETLKRNLMDVLQKTCQKDVLFVCDIAGGTPFRESAFLCTTCESYVAVAGINISALSEICFNRHLNAGELAQLAQQVTLQSQAVFPLKK